MSAASDIDLGIIQPVARDVARQVAEVYVRHLGPDLVTLVAHGSGVKGGMIAGSSDLDFVAIVRPESTTSGGELPFERVVALHRDLAHIDHAPFRYIQVYAYGGRIKRGVGFIPGTYQVLYGTPDIPIVTAAELVDSARTALRALDVDALRDYLSNALLDHGEGRLARQVRGLSTDVWPTMYQVACLCEDDPIRTWQRTKLEAVETLKTEPIVGSPIQRWLAAITTHYATGESVDTALETLVAGIAFLEAASEWAHRHLPESP